MSALTYVIVDRLFGKDDFKKWEAIAAAQGIAQAREKQRLENLERWREIYQKHSEQFGQAIFEAYNSKYVIASCTLDNYSFNYRDPGEPDIQYVGQALDHLRTGYPSLWEMCENARRESLKTLNRIQEIVKSIETLALGRMEEEPNLALVKSEKWSPPIARYYYVPGTVWALVMGGSSQVDIRFGYQRINTEIVDEKGERSRRDLMELLFCGQSLGRGEESDMRQLRTSVECLMLDSNVQGLAREYQNQVEKLTKQAKDHDRVVHHLWSQIQAGKPLLGSCDLCPQKPS